MNETIPSYPKSIQKNNTLFEFSICTLVTRKGEYEEMLKSFHNSGFNSDFCEYLFVDNTEANVLDAFEAFNLFLRQAKGKYIIICHQDVLINRDDVSGLRSRLKELDLKDPDWAICGNAGAVGPNHVVYHISYPDQDLISKGQFPIKVSAVDENFILVKNSALLKVSNNLKGFHLYGTDLCLQAELNGFSTYVIAFDLTHKSYGNKDEEFYRLRKALIKKYNSFFRSRWIQTNSTVFFLSGSFFGSICGSQIVLFFVRMKNGLRKKWLNGK